MKAGWTVVLVVVVAAAAWVGGGMNARRGAPAPPPPGPGAGAVTHYACPMHPQYRSDKPGDCMACGMRLEPVSDADAASAERAETEAGAAGAIRVSAAKQQTIGVRVGRAERRAVTRSISTVGKVAVDENRVHRVVALYEGRLTNVMPFVVGSRVAAGQVLAVCYSPAMLSAQQTYLYSIGGLSGRFSPDQAARMRATTQAQVLATRIQTPEDTLRAAGLADEDIAAIRKSGKLMRTLSFRAPASGVVISRSAYSGMPIDKGAELYRIADLSRLWIQVDIFEDEARYLRPGSEVRVSIPGRSETFRARVSDSVPQFDPASRTQKFRLDVDNPGLRLRPEMLVDVSIPVALPGAVTVPADAVVDAGRTKTVFVETGPGSFVPRAVQIGWRAEDRVAITAGLRAGERVVVSGAFLIDSESRLKSVGAPALPPPPAMSHDADEAKPRSGETAPRAGMATPRSGKTAPHEDMAMPGGGEMKPAAAGTAKDPVCGMDVDPKMAAGRVMHAGTQYLFCSDGCLKKFKANPASYLAGTGG